MVVYGLCLLDMVHNNMNTHYKLRSCNKTGQLVQSHDNIALISDSSPIYSTVRVDGMEMCGAMVICMWQDNCTV